jgi:hypothetical protein
MVMVMDSTIAGNRSDFVNGGAGVTNVGTATITDSTITKNTTTAGIFAAGGLLNFDAVTVTDSTITDNAARSAFATPEAGGLLNEDLATASITDSTITDNTMTAPVADAAGGLHNDGGTVDIGASIVAANSANGSADNCGVTAGSLTSVGYNLTDDVTGAACGFTQATDKVNVNPDLGPLTDNGGRTKTQLPAPNSPAVGVIPSPTTLNGVAVCGPGAFDQRGLPRPSPGPNGNCTIGAIEVQGPPHDDTT